MKSWRSLGVQDRRLQHSHRSDVQSQGIDSESNWDPWIPGAGAEGGRSKGILASEWRRKSTRSGWSCGCFSPERHLISLWKKTCQQYYLWAIMTRRSCTLFTIWFPCGATHGGGGSWRIAWRATPQRGRRLARSQRSWARCYWAGTMAGMSEVPARQGV